MSVIKVNKIENTGTTDGGVEIDSSGHVQVDGVQMPTAGALSNRNLIINGAMLVAQRGTSSTSSGYHTVDRFPLQFSQGAQTQTQESLTSGSPYSEGFRKFARIANTTASTDAAAKRQISYIIEAQDLANSGWNYTSSSSYITLSFWVRASVTQTYYVNLTTLDGTAQHYAFAISLTADTWTKIEQTIPGSSNITIDNDNGAGMQIDFVPFFGTNFTDSGFTVDAWAAFSGSSRYPDFTNTWANTTNATFDLTGVQLEVGEKATPFEHRSYGDELARCQRYFLKTGDIGTSDEWFPGVATHANDGNASALAINGLNDRAFIVERFPTTMRAAGTVLFYPGRTDVTNDVDNITVYNNNTKVTFSGEPIPSTRGFVAFFSGTSADSAAYSLQYTVDSEL